MQVGLGMNLGMNHQGAERVTQSVCVNFFLSQNL